MSNSRPLTTRDDEPIGEEVTDLAADAIRRVTPRHGWQAIDIGDLWQFRELFWILALRDVKVRYKQTVLGVAWAILQPFCAIVVFAIIAGLRNSVPDGGHLGGWGSA